MTSVPVRETATYCVSDVRDKEQSTTHMSGRNMFQAHSFCQACRARIFAFLRAAAGAARQTCGNKSVCLHARRWAAEFTIVAAPNHAEQSPRACSDNCCRDHFLAMFRRVVVGGRRRVDSCLLRAALDGARNGEVRGALKHLTPR